MKYFFIGLAVVGAIVIVLMVRAGLVLLSVKNYANYWQKVAAEPKPDNAITLIAMGDSAAQGVGASKPQYSYVGRLATAINEQTGKPVHIINISKSGAKLDDVLHTQLPQLDKLDQKNAIITLDIGTNDVNRGDYKDDELSSKLDELFSKLPKKTVVADLPDLRKSRWQKNEPRMVAANVKIHEIAEKYGLSMAPLHEQLRINNSWRLYSGDFFHPGNYGYEIWFRAFWQVVEGQLKQF